MSLDPALLNNFANEDLGVLGGEHVADEIQDLFERLAARLVWIVDNMLTKRQSEIVRMVFLESKTQTEVARILGLCQPSVHKSLLGNLSYDGDVDKPPRRYGGALRKISLICDSDTEVQSILAQIEELRKESQL